MRRQILVLVLHAIRAWDRLRLRWLALRHPGLEVHPRASSNFASARYSLGPGARLCIGPEAVTERLPGALHIALEAGARIDVGEGVWLRTELGPVHLIAFEGARIQVGAGSLLNGCHLSAKRSITMGRRVSLGVGSRVFDADQHDLDADRLEQVEPVTLGDHVWVAADVTVLRGVEIGAHSVVGTRSLVNSSIPPHSLAYGQPARVRGPVGDRGGAR